MLVEALTATVTSPKPFNVRSSRLSTCFCNARRSSFSSARSRHALSMARKQIAAAIGLAVCSAVQIQATPCSITADGPQTLLQPFVIQNPS